MEEAIFYWLFCDLPSWWPKLCRSYMKSITSWDIAISVFILGSILTVLMALKWKKVKSLVCVIWKLLCSVAKFLGKVYTSFINFLKIRRQLFVAKICKQNFEIQQAHYEKELRVKELEISKLSKKLKDNTNSEHKENYNIITLDVSIYKHTFAPYYVVQIVEVWTTKIYKYANQLSISLGILNTWEFIKKELEEVNVLALVVVIVKNSDLIRLKLQVSDTFTLPSGFVLEKSRSLRY